MQHSLYMQRCVQLALLGEGSTAPNPMVGSVLVHNNRIIGEGYHKQYGGPHAEVNCIASVKEKNKHLIPEATLYVSLEPCAHFGKTPPCAELIIRENIKQVVIGCSDPFSEVNGKGIEKLKAAGIHITLGILEKECKDLNKRFFTFHTKHRPYIILKWVQTGDSKIANADNSRLLISNEYTNRLVHQWRSQEQGILIGTNTALLDNPELTTRLWPGPNPIRLLVDMDLRLPSSLHLFDGSVKTIVFNKYHHQEKDNLFYYQVTEDVNLVHQIVNALYQLRIQSILVEGGARLLQSFIDEGLWDEARVITNRNLFINNGLSAPVLPYQQLVSIQTLMNDEVHYFINPGS